MSRAWIFQNQGQLKKLGGKAPWLVGWLDPEGKRKSKTVGAKSRAEKFARKLEGQLAAGLYESTSRKAWAEYRAEYLERGLPAAAPATREAYRHALNHFERIAKPARLDAITGRTLAAFVAARRGEGVAVATINKELRHLRAVVRKAAKWGYLPRVPEIEFLREPGRLPTYVTPEHFTALYANADAARWPDCGPFTAADWWQALLVTAYMTGWRIGSLLALKWADVDLEAATAISRAEDNKGKRDQRIPLHPLVVDHLRRLKCFSPVVFQWNHGSRGLWPEFATIQKAAGVKPDGKPLYGFHDMRRAFATMNADRLTPDALQALMQHRDYQTTQRYISMARQLSPAVANLYAPTLPDVASG